LAVREYERQAEKSSHKPHQQEYLERAKRRSVLVADVQGKLKQTLQRIEDLDKQETATREQMLVP